MIKQIWQNLISIYIVMATIVALTASITIRAMAVKIQKDGKGVGENLCI